MIPLKLTFLALSLSLLLSPPARGRVLSCDEIFQRMAPVTVSARESAILDRAVLQNFEESLFDIEPPSRELAEQWSRRVMTGLTKLPTPKVSPGEKALLTTEDLHELFARQKASRIMESTCGDNNPYEKTKGVAIGFCFGRAVGTHLLAGQMGLTNDSIRKVWVVGAMEANGVDWSHHVATAVRHDSGRWYVLDSYFDTPKGLADWFQGWQRIDTNGKLMLFATKADRFGPESNDPMFKATAEKGSFHNFFHDLFRSARREGEDLSAQIESLSNKGPPPALKEAPPPRRRHVQRTREEREAARALRNDQAPRPRRRHVQQRRGW